MAKEMIYNLVKDEPDLKFAQQFHFSKNFMLLAYQLLGTNEKGYQSTVDAMLPFPSCFLQFDSIALLEVLEANELRKKQPRDSVLDDIRGVESRSYFTDIGVWLKDADNKIMSKTYNSAGEYVPILDEQDREYLGLFVSLSMLALQLLNLKSQFITKTVVTGLAKKSAFSKVKRNQPRIRHTYVDVKMTDEQLISLSDDPRKRSSPGLHLVRGHFKLLKSGKLTWWRPFVRGKKEHGVIAHEYRVHTGEEHGKLG